jgi:Fic family protein
MKHLQSPAHNSFADLPTDLIRQYDSAFPAPTIDGAWRLVAEQRLDEEVIQTLGVSEIEARALIASWASCTIEGCRLSFSNVVNALISGHHLPFHKEVHDLQRAYLYCTSHDLNEVEFCKAHAITSETLLKTEQRGVYRKHSAIVANAHTQEIVYVACPVATMPVHLHTLWQDIALLLSQKMTIAQTLFCASYLHCEIVGIHPFSDGNGRMGRLLEKWFLIQKLGSGAWSIQSEHYYADHRIEYYHALSVLRQSFVEREYGQALPFFSLLPQCLLQRHS